ncbi:hypothetical protein [Hydrogenophaga sp.]|uniref:hypothetical protein n=1 Tax=Hydrogenophaga sp. TaxID=1904254 RepID=UPI00271B3E33|nr:hypothetical protein [Hydrogenophaga sp.]MDO8904159.1 hypothetical protein [Hydrogenophaga sp.]
MNVHRADPVEEIAAVAARMVVEEGLDFAAAKRRAIKQMGLGVRTAMPDNTAMEAAVREYIGVFCSETQPQELLALRQTALLWMERMSRFRPHLSGAVWHGWATRHCDIHLHLYCDDPKEAEWALLDHRVDYHPGLSTGRDREPVQALTLRTRCDALAQWVLVHLMVHDLDDLRGALRPDAEGRKPRGDAVAVRSLLSAPSGEVAS